MKEKLINKNLVVEFDGKEITARVLTGSGHTVWSRTKRGVKKAWEQINYEWNEATAMHDMTNIFEQCKIRCSTGFF